MEVGGHHIVFRPNPDDVGVGEISVQHGIGKGTIALVAPAVISIHLDKIRTNIGLLGLNGYVAEVDIAGMTYEEPLGGQVAPHG